MSVKQINLLPSEEFEESTFGRILKWALTSFRIMIMGVNIVVICAFLSRFFLDARNNDLGDRIKVLQGTIIGNSDFEKEFRETQVRLSIYRDLASDESASAVISKISSRLPIDVFLLNISVNNDTILLKGSTSNEASISQLMANLVAESSFEDVSLSSVSSNEDNLGQFDFTLNLKTKREEG